MLRRHFFTLIIVAALPVAACSSCKNEGSSAQPAASASSSAPAGPTLEHGSGLGLEFTYPSPYRVELSTSNPTAHQIAISHDKRPGLVTIRVNSVDPTAPIDLDQVADSTRLTMDPSGTISPTTMKVGSKTFAARAVKSSSLGLVPVTDVLAVVPIGGRNYLVMLHSANEDVGEAAKMFAVVLGSLKPD